MRIGALAGLTWIAVACSHVPDSSKAEPTRAPVADHHQHLLSPAGAALQNELLPAVPLPPELAAVLKSRGEHWNDKAALAELFAEDAILHTPDAKGWIQGRAAIADFLAFIFSRGYELVPARARIGDRTAELGGYLMRDRTNPIAFFAMSLEKGPQGWKITSETPVLPGPRRSVPVTADQLVAALNEAGIRRAVVLSDAYYFSKLEEERTENDWTAEQVKRFPDRLVAFCSVNPLADFAIDELERCASSGHFKGLKLHLGTSRVDLRDVAHVAKLRAVVAAANDRRLALIVHVRFGSSYGRREAQTFLDQIVSAAPDVVFQIAHLWGGEQFSPDALEVYADAVSSGDPRARNLFFDLAEVALVVRSSKQAREAVAARIRQIGLARILYASDGPVGETQSPKEAWETTRTLPLTEEELSAIAGNVAPYLR